MAETGTPKRRTKTRVPGKGIKGPCGSENAWQIALVGTKLRFTGGSPLDTARRPRPTASRATTAASTSAKTTP